MRLPCVGHAGNQIKYRTQNSGGFLLGLQYLFNGFPVDSIRLGTGSGTNPYQVHSSVHVLNQ